MDNTLLQHGFPKGEAESWLQNSKENVIGIGCDEKTPILCQCRKCPHPISVGVLLCRITCAFRGCYANWPCGQGP